jgi:hypothetical protein
MPSFIQRQVRFAQCTVAGAVFNARSGIAESRPLCEDGGGARVEALAGLAADIPKARGR